MSASKRSFSSSKTGKFDSKNRRSPISTKEDGEEEKESELASEINYGDATGTAEGAVDVDDGFVMPKLPGEEPDFWEGPQWDGLGFFVQYLWAFGILFAVNFILISAPFHFNFGLLLSILSDGNILFFVGFGQNFVCYVDMIEFDFYRKNMIIYFCPILNSRFTYQD